MNLQPSRSRRLPPRRALPPVPLERRRNLLMCSHDGMDLLHFSAVDVLFFFLLGFLIVV